MSDTTEKRPPGRPPKLTPEQRQELYVAFKEYIQTTDDPTTVDFVTSNELALEHLITRENLKDWDEFSPLQKIAIEKQEAYLLKNAGSGKYNATVGIFRLKQPQHGYTDRSQLDTAAEVTHKYEDLDDEQLEKLVQARANRAA